MWVTLSAQFTAHNIIAAFRFDARFYTPPTFGVVPLGPVVAGPGLPEHEVVGAEDLTEGAGAHAVHGAGLEIHQHGLHSTGGERRPR